MTNKYYPTVGLEIHAELATKTKMFCGCLNNPDEKKPNVNICPVCLAHPGALPVLNKKAIENAIKVGLAINGKIADFTEFDRKNYFYPDIPKGYQISQYKYPIISGGHLAGFDITRVHLEEDTANNKHIESDFEEKQTLCEAGFSLIDFNRSGVPLMELVTEPKTFENAEEAVKTTSKFAKELQLILWYLKVSEANMEKGEMRVEANISVSENKNKLGTKVEVKNLNSFRSIERAIKFELKRLTELLEDNKAGEIIQETRGWDENKQKTFSQRKKESSEDYRYFPEPDLPKLKLHKAFNLEKMKKELPELPEAKRTRFKKDFGIKDEDIEAYINDSDLGVRFSAIAEILTNKPASVEAKEKIKIASNYVTSDFMGLKKTNLAVKPPSAENFAELINLVYENKISSRAAKDILAMIVVDDASPLKIAKREGLFQTNDENALKKIAQKTIEANPKAAADYKGGKENALMSLVGQIMKETKGGANPIIIKKILLELLK